jgi:hypothetical protein
MTTTERRPEDDVPPPVHEPKHEPPADEPDDLEDPGPAEEPPRD